ncbi:MAG: polymorphic outer membrane protein, partial [Verrucomicrobiota bacterium]
MKTKQAPRRTAISRALSFLPLVAALALASNASAQLYYQTNGTNATWTTSVWGTGATGPFTTAWSSNSSVIFGVASTGTNLLTFATTTVSNITVNGNTVISQAGTASSVTNGSTVDVAAGMTLSWSNQNWSASADRAKWIKNGAGTWIIGSQGTQVAAGGGLTLNNGTVILGNSTAFGGTNARLTINGGVIAWDGGSGNTTRNMSGSVTINGSFGLSNVTASAASFSGLSNATGTNTINLTTGVTITNLSANTFTFSPSITNTGSLTFTNGATGTGQLKLSGSNNFSGGVTLNSGRLGLNNANALGTGTFTVNGGALDADNNTTLTGNNTTWAGSFSYAGTAALTFGSQVNLATNLTVTVSGATNAELGINGFTGNGFVLTKAGAGVLKVNGAVTNLGGVTVNAGWLALASSSGNLAGLGTITMNGGILASFGTSRTLTGDVVAAADFQLGGAGFQTTLSNISLGGATRTITLDNSAIVNGAITNGSLVMAVTPGSAGRNFTLNPTASYTGSTLTQNGGALIMNGTMGTNTAVNIAATTVATNDISANAASSVTYGSLAGGANANLLLGAKNLTVGGNNTSTTFAGVASGVGGSITKSGNGTMTFSGTSTYDGATTVSGGRFVMNGTNSSSAVTVASGASIGGSGQIGALTVSGTLAPGNSVGTLSVGNTVFNQNGSFQLEMFNWAGTAGTDWDKLAIGGSLTLSNTIANPFTINLVSMSSTTNPGLSTGWNPDVNWTNNFVTYTSLASTFDGSAFSVNYGAFSNTLNGTFSVITNGNALALLYTTSFVPSSAFDWNTGSGNWSTAGNWTNGSAPANGNSIIFSGAGGNSTNDAVTSLKGIVFSNTASGSYVVSGNTFTNGVDGIVNNSSSGQTISSDVVLGIGQTFNAASGSLTFGGAIDTAGLALTVQGASNTVINGAISGSGGSIIKTGAGSLVLNGANSYSGGTTVNGGTLAGDTTSLQGGIVNNATVVFNQATNGSYGSAMSGTGVLVKQGAGSLTLNAANTYSGGTLVSGGALVGDTTSMRGVITNNATIVYNQTADGTNSSLISGSGALVKAGSATLTLNANGNTMDSMTVSEGVMIVRSTNTLNTVTVAGGASLGYGTALNTPLGTATITLQDGSAFGQAGSIGSTTNDRIIGNNLVLVGNVRFGAIAGTSFGSYFGGNIDLAGGTRTITFSNSSYVGGVISNGTGLVLDSGGSATRSFSLTNGVATYSGATTNNGGVIMLTGSGALPSGTALNLAGATTNASLDISSITGSSATIGSLAGSSTASVTMTNKNLTVGGDNTSTTFAGVMSGAGGSLTKSGNGTFALGGANTYSGGTLVSGGALVGDTRSLQGAVTNNARVIFDQTTNGTYSSIMSGSGSLTKNSAGTVTLSGANSYSGGTVVNAGTLAGSTTSLQGAISNSSVVEFSQSTNGTYAGVVSGSGSLVKSGSGTVTLGGANSYNGGTLISAGALSGDTTSLQGAITNNATLVFNQSTGGSYSGTLSGNGVLTKSGSGTLTLSGNSSGYSGVATVGGGTLAVSANNAMGTGSVSVTNGSVIAKNGVTIANNLSLGGAASSASYYTQNFNSLGSGLPTDWTVRGGATGSSLGTNAGYASTATAWGAIASPNLFANVAATTGLTEGSTTSAQAGSTDRSLGVQQTGSFGDPGASVVYSFNTLGISVSSISLDLMMIKTNTRSTTWSIEYGLGSSPTSFTSLGTWVDPVVWGSTSTNFTTSNFGTNLDNQSAVVFRVVALTGSSGSGTRPTIALDNFAISNTIAGSGSGTLGIEEAGSATFSGNVTVNTAGTLTAAANGQATFSGNFSGAGGITKTGSGTVVLSGSNSYSGGTTVSAGEVRGTSSSLQGAITNSATVVFDQSGNGTYSGGMAGTGVLVKAGSGTLELGNSTYSGGTLLNGGAINLAGNTALGTGTVTIGNNTILSSVTTGRTLANNIVAAGDFTLGNGTQATTFNGGLDLGGATRTISLDNSATFNGVVSNGGLVINSINATNTRNFTLAASNAFAGGITLNSGNLRLTHVNGAGTGAITQTDGTSEVQIRTGGTITNDMSVYRVAFINGAELSGALTLNNTIFDVTNNITATNSGTLSGTGGVDKIGAGTLVLSASNTFTGGIAISNGAVSVSADSNLGAAPLTATAGNVTLDGGTLHAAAGFTLGANRGIGLGASGGTIEVAGAQALAYGGIAAGTGAITKSGNGTLTLSGANSLTGATTVSAGTLELANASGEVLGSTASLGVASGATLLVSQSNQVNNSASVSLTGGTIRTASG